MSEIPGMPELPKQPIGTNQWLNSATYIIIMVMGFLLAGFYIWLKRSDIAETKVSSDFTQMAIGFAQKATENQQLIEENNRMKIELQQCKAEKWQDNTYLKKKVLNPLKKKYNGR